MDNSNNSSVVSLQECFADLPDPRMEGKIAHKLLDIVCLTICAFLCGADSWVEVEQFGHGRREWLRRFLELPHGIPSHDTVGRVFSLLSPAEIQGRFRRWVQGVSEALAGQVVAVDGKTVRRSYDSAANQSAIHMVSAWAGSDNLVLGQLKTDAKSNEITAIPELLKLLELKGCIVTLDAMGCQKEIAEQIVTQGADYVLALKGNQTKLHEAVCEKFEEVREQEPDEQDARVTYYERTESGHGRVETRRCWTLPAGEELPGYDQWKNLTTLVCMESERCVDEKTTRECRHFLSSLAGDAETLAGYVREHWGIENSLHWVLDVAFREDDCRVRKGHAPENLATIRHLVRNLLKQETSAKVGVRVKRFKAAIDDRYLEKVLSLA